MATKFITIRIPIPSLSWFTKEEEPLYEPCQDFSARTAEIKARIAAVRSSLRESEKSSKVSQTRPEHVVAKEPQQPARDPDRAQRAQELDALKAKLLGKKR